MRRGKKERGHHEFSNDVCAKCGMTRKQYDDSGKPRCKGNPEVPEQVVFEIPC
jgi:hypothetical protein